MTTFEEWMEWAEARAARVDGCLVWKLSFNGNAPQACIGDRDQKQTVNVRRKLWSLRTGKEPRRGWVVVCKCDTHGCIEPSHLKEISRSQMLKGKPLTPQHRLALTMAARTRKNVKLSMDAVNDIRYGDGTPQEKAQRWGVSERYVEDVMRHRGWKDFSSPFAQLGAR